MLVDELRGALGVATNNVAEYHGLLAALAWAADAESRRSNPVRLGTPRQADARHLPGQAPRPAAAPPEGAPARRARRPRPLPTRAPGTEQGSRPPGEPGDGRGQPETKMCMPGAGGKKPGREQRESHRRGCHLLASCGGGGGGGSGDLGEGGGGGRGGGDGVRGWSGSGCSSGVCGGRVQCAPFCGRRGPGIGSVARVPGGKAGPAAGRRGRPRAPSVGRLGGADPGTDCGRSRGGGLTGEVSCSRVPDAENVSDTMSSATS